LPHICGRTKEQLLERQARLDGKVPGRIRILYFTQRLACAGQNRARGLDRLDGRLGHQGYEDAPIDERMKEIAWRHVDFGHCGSDRNTAGRKIIFGKEFEPVCGSTFRFNNPSGEALECSEKMAKLRKKDILNRHSI